MSKFAALAAVLLSLFIVACASAPAPTPSPAPPATPIAATKSGTLRFYDLVNLDVRDIPMLMALQDLESQGYKVEKNYVASSTIMAEALSRGDADVGIFNAQTAWSAIGKGAPIRTIIQFTGGTFIIASKADITDCHALAGKRVGMASTSGANPALLTQYLEQKCDSAKPEYVVIAESGARSTALMAGQLDASFMPAEELIKIQDQAPDKFHILIPISKEFPNVLVDTLHARREWLDQNPQLARDFIRSILKANRAVIANPQLLYDESVKRLKLEPTVAKEIADLHLQNGIWSANGGLTTENIQSSLDFYQQAAGLPKTLKVADVSDLSYLKTVLDEIGRK